MATLPIYRMLILKYLPERMYGFAVLENTEQQVFFHLGSFDPGKEPVNPHKYCLACSQTHCDWAYMSPPPVAGEPVDVEVDLTSIPEGTAVPRAKRVIRIEQQIPLKGVIKTFDNQRGYGFIECVDGTTHYIHKSDIIGKRFPMIGHTVMFFAGQKKDKTRACHVRLCS